MLNAFLIVNLIGLNHFRCARDMLRQTCCIARDCFRFVVFIVSMLLFLHQLFKRSADMCSCIGSLSLLLVVDETQTPLILQTAPTDEFVPWNIHFLLSDIAEQTIFFVAEEISP